MFLIFIWSLSIIYLFNYKHLLIILRKNKIHRFYFFSQNAKELSATDKLLLTILCHENQPSGLDAAVFVSSYQILLSGPERQPKCLPHNIHKISLFEGISVMYLIEIGNPAVASSIYETFCHLHTMQQVQIQRDKVTLQMACENLDIAIRRLNDSLKKNKNVSIETSYKKLIKKWDVIKKKYLEYLKIASDESLLRAEALSLGFLENLKELLHLTSIDEEILKYSEEKILEVGVMVKKQMKSFEDFLRIKNMNITSLGPYPLLTLVTTKVC